MYIYILQERSTDPTRLKTRRPLHLYPVSVPSSMSRSDFKKDPFLSYSRSLHDYTLRLWTESRRVAEEEARNKATRRDVGDPSRWRKQPESCSPQFQRSTAHN
ncbi:hypothetical protein EDD16DRAFT_1574959 [Pisolithus croceorrhizus]|nr:hypothetical protein EDD16DRAFT_1574959 [Pisolithus croceorrhizus]KAI6135494.1 hypothetical protein EV401DRAFT_1901105 [Pisolithus croceorrhizus]